MRIFVTGPSDVRMDEQQVIKSKVATLLEVYPDAEFVFTSFPGTEFISMYEVLKAGRSCLVITPWSLNDAHPVVRNMVKRFAAGVDVREMKSFDYTAKTLFRVRQLAVENSDHVVVFGSESVVDLAAFTCRVASISGRLLEFVPLTSNTPEYEGYFTPYGSPTKVGEVDGSSKV